MIFFNLSTFHLLKTLSILQSTGMWMGYGERTKTKVYFLINLKRKKVGVSPPHRCRRIDVVVVVVVGV